MTYKESFKDFEIQFRQASENTFKNHNFYIVPMFPYPSGNIHMGHMRVYTISSVIARYKNKKGFDVLHSIGFDSFGLPAEAAAIKNKINPAIWTEQNIEKMISDFKAMNFNFDWDHQIKTHDIKYYKFEQEIFKKAWENGIIYKKEQYVNYDPIDNTVLSNEQVINGKSCRSGADIIRKKYQCTF